MIKTRRLLIIENSQELIDTLKEQLELTGEFDVSATRIATDALQLLEEKNSELIILSCSDVIEETQELISSWRKANVNIPILVIMGNASDSTAIKLLDSGANDYIAKPFRMTLLVARIRAHLRQYDRSADAVLTIGPYWFKQDNSTLTHKEEESCIRLTDKEAAILKYLYHSFPQVVPRSKLLDEVWGYTSGVSTHTLETHIYRLRQKMEPDPKNVSILLTENRGYRLNLQEM
ncbi:MAG: response regulator transcription factor [Alphaproteobacteria bacterium]